ncbi:MAG TPA: hypothetical protein VF183_16185 [Acidimicrobiales bacterium]
MKLTMLRAKVKSDRAQEAVEATQRWFAAVEEAKPNGVRYASCHLPDGVTYVVLLRLDDGIDNPLPSLPAFGEFQKNLQEVLAEPGTPEELTVVGSYNLF